MKKNKRHGEVRIVDGKPYLWTSKGYKLARTEVFINNVVYEKWDYKGCTFFPHVRHGYPKHPAIKVKGVFSDDD